MEYSSTASALMEAINKKKKQAINDGIIRAEKPLDCISDKEKPYKLPEGWMWVRLGDYALKVTDYVASGSFASLKENVLITNEPNYAIMVKTADFANGFTKNLTYTDQHGYEFLANSNLFGGELILSNIGSIGKVFIVPYLEYPMTLASNTVMVKVTDDELIKYLYYYFLSPLGQRTLKGISSGTSMMKFNKTQLKNTLVPVAPLKKQKEIVTLLEKTQAIIEARRLELQKLDELIKARFVEMFGDPEFNNMGWKTNTLGSLCNVGSSKRIYQNEQSADVIPFLRISDLVNRMDTGELTCDLYIPEQRFAELLEQKLVPEEGDILLTARGTLGRCYIIQPEDRFYFQDGMISWLSDFSESITALYISYLFEMPGFRKQIDALQAGSTVAYLSIAMTKKLLVMLPPMELQEQFADFVKQIDKSKVIEHNAFRCFKYSLMPGLIAA